MEEKILKNPKEKVVTQNFSIQTNEIERKNKIIQTSSKILSQENVFSIQVKNQIP